MVHSLFYCIPEVTFWTLKCRNPQDTKSHQSTLFLFPVFCLSLTPDKDFLTRISYNIQSTIHPLPFRSLLRVFSSSFPISHFPSGGTLLKHWNHYIVQKCRTRGKKQQKFQVHTSTQAISRVPQQYGVTEDARWAAQVLSGSIRPCKREKMCLFEEFNRL